jgi:hypothetical protein
MSKRRTSVPAPAWFERNVACLAPDWEPGFRPPSAKPSQDFKDKPFQYVVDRIDTADLATVTAYLIACTQRLRDLGEESAFKALCSILEQLQSVNKSGLK